jgi:hypothetical protein
MVKAEERSAEGAIWSDGMKKRNKASRKYVICIDNSGHPVALELHKIYEIMPDERAAEDDCLRVIEESGEHDLYSSERFVPVDLPNRAQESMSRLVLEAAAIS